MELRSPTANRLVLFVIGTAVVIVAGVLVAASVSGFGGLSSPALATALASAIISVGLLGLSARLLRSEAASLADLGLPTNRARRRELGVGFLLSATLFSFVALAQSAMVGGAWHYQGARGIGAAFVALLASAIMVLAEELVFRGVGLRYLQRLYGDRAAIGISALLFGAYHLVGSGDWAMGAVFRVTMPALGGLLFGWAALRTAGLALPIGLHLGGNWIQLGVAGFVARNASGSDTPVQTLWRIPITGSDVQTLTAPDILPRLPYLSAIAVASLATWILIRRQRPGAVASGIDRGR